VGSNPYKMPPPHNNYRPTLRLCVAARHCGAIVDGAEGAEPLLFRVQCADALATQSHAAATTKARPNDKALELLFTIAMENVM
jgi:hypothetical protein